MCIWHTLSSWFRGCLTSVKKILKVHFGFYFLDYSLIISVIGCSFRKYIVLCILLCSSSWKLVIFTEIRGKTVIFYDNFFHPQALKVDFNAKKGCKHNVKHIRSSSNVYSTRKITCEPMISWLFNFQTDITYTRKWQFFLHFFQILKKWPIFPAASKK